MSQVTARQVVIHMLNAVDGQLGTEPFDLIDASRRSAAVLLGERDTDLREETQLRVIEVSLLAINAVCAALGVDPDAIEEQPADLSTIGGARAALAKTLAAGRT